jgi:hypothetical protein
VTKKRLAVQYHAGDNYFFTRVSDPFSEAGDVQRARRGANAKAQRAIEAKSSPYHGTVCVRKRDAPADRIR